MTVLKVTPTSGEFPRLRSNLLPDNAAQFAQDCDFLRGTLAGLRVSAPVPSIVASNIKSLFIYEGGPSAGNQFWWDRDVDAVKSPVVNDAYERFYWSDGTAFYVSRGDVGGQGEPSQSNRYKVGVPRPVAGLQVSQVKFEFPGVTSIDIEVADELTDGKFTNKAGVTGATWSYTPTGATLTFAARAPQPEGGNATVTTATSPLPALSDLRYERAVTLGGDRTNGPQKALYVKPGSSTRYLYNDDPVIQGPQLYTWYKYGDSVIGFTMYRLAGTNWYSNISGAAAPSISGPTTQIATTANQPVAGAVVLLTFNTADGPLHAAVRKDSNKVTWPDDLPALTASVSSQGGNYTVKFGVQQKYIEARAYTYTYVNQYGEEGPAAEPVNLECAEGATLSLTYAVAQNGYCPISKVRIYRTSTSTTDYLFVGEVLYNANTRVFTDNVSNEQLGEPISTSLYYPPDQTLRGLCVMNNGILVGFKGNELHFSEPYLPYAWNPSAIKPLPNKIMGVCPFEGGLYVTTTAYPYIITGTEPLSMTDARIPVQQGGVSKGSIASVNGQVAFASNDGIVLAQGVAASLDLSFKLFTRAEWRDWFGSKLDKMRLVSHDGSLLVWFDDGTPGVLIRFEEEQLSMTRLTDVIRAAFVNPADDALYVSDGTSIKAFRTSAARKPFAWWSKDFTLPRPENFGACQVRGDGTLTLEVHADGQLRHTETNLSLSDAGQKIVRLPSGFLARTWSVRLTGTAEVVDVVLAGTQRELSHV